MADKFLESKTGRLLRSIEERLREGHLLNAIFMGTELMQEMLREHGQIRHGKQKDVSWLSDMIQKPVNPSKKERLAALTAEIRQLKQQIQWVKSNDGKPQ